MRIQSALVVLAALLLPSLALLRAAETPAQPTPAVPARTAVECTPRAGWPNFLAKAAKGGDLKVGYLGGSITAQTGWRVKSLAWLRTQYPQSKFTEINAAIGGTGSNLGVLRIEHDVFGGRPDLLFVEFAVNDAGASPQEIIRSMEGIVRKTWRAFPECDICFVYTFSEPLLAELKAGKLNRSAATMEQVADHYGIPTIHLGLEAVHLEAAGKLSMRAPEKRAERVAGDELNEAARLATNADGKIPFSPDGVHPYIDTGHQLYLEAIVRSVPLIQKASGAAGAHRLTAPLDAGNYERSTMVSLDDLHRSGPWVKLPADNGLGKSFANRVNSLWQGAPGAEVSFRFKGTDVRLYDLVGPDCGFIEVTVDGKSTRVRRIDGYCTYWRLGLANVGTGLDPAKVHDVTIRVLDEKVPKAEILFEKNRADLAQHPEKYAGTNWYAGAVFVIGEVVSQP